MEIVKPLRARLWPPICPDSKTTRDGARGLSWALHLLCHFEYTTCTRDGARGRPLGRLHAPWLAHAASPLAARLAGRGPTPDLGRIVALAMLQKVVRHHQH